MSVENPTRADSLKAVTPEAGVAKPDPIISVSAMRKAFGGLVAVNVDHLEIQRGVITGLIGPNGAGKTTFFNLLTGFDKPDTGHSTYRGSSIDGKRPYKLASIGMVRTFQLTKALSKLSVIENMKLGAGGQRGERFWLSLIPPLWKHQERGIEKRADELLERFQLGHMRDEYAGTLSGGQRKLLEMARSLMTEPDVIMLDEPMAGVNPALTQSLLGHVKDLAVQGITVVFVEHDMDVVRDISDWVVVMAEGAIIAEGPHATIGANPVVIDAYLGRHHDAPLDLDQETEWDGRGSSPRRGRRGRRMNEPIIRLEGIVAGYLPGVDILNGVDLELGANELIGIIGPNGAGKSTLLKSLLGLLDVRAGSVEFKGESIVGLKAHELVARGIGYVPQVDNVFPSLTVAENLEMGAFLELDKRDERLGTVLEMFPKLEERFKQRTGSLSGGERQMVAMGRALMMAPKVLLLDEPSAGLSPVLQDQVFIRAKQINRSGVAIIMVEQNARRCLQICDRGYVLDQGKNAHTGTGAELLEDPKVIELYLGTLARVD